jgi:hypothetical protein
MDTRDGISVHLMEEKRSSVFLLPSMNGVAQDPLEPSKTACGDVTWIIWGIEKN